MCLRDDTPSGSARCWAGAPRRPTGCRSSAGRTSCSGSPTARSCSSTGPSPSARPMAPWPARGPGDPALPRHTAASAYLHEKAGDPRTAARLYADAARSPHLARAPPPHRQAARISQALRGQVGWSTPPTRRNPLPERRRPLRFPRESSHKTRPVKVPAQVALTRVRIDHFAPTCAPDDGVAVQIDPAETRAFVAKLVAAADATPTAAPTTAPTPAAPRRPPGRRPPRHRPRPQRRTRRPPA